VEVFDSKDEKVAIATILTMVQKKLHQVIVEHFFKAIFNKNICSSDKDAFFANYKNLSNNLSEIVKACNPDFKYPVALSTNIIKMAMDHNYFAEKLCSLTEITNCIKTKRVQLEDMINYFVGKLLAK